MTALVYGIVRAATAGWDNPLTVAALAAGAALLTLLVLNERRAREPVMPLRLFASRERTGAYAARILFLGAMLGFWFFITQYLQEVRGYSPVQAGVAFLPMTVANFAAAVAVPGVTRRIGNPRLLAAGVAITLIVRPARTARAAKIISGSSRPPTKAVQNDQVGAA
jgi:predicted MFS family arabinose efflux permease